MTSLIDTPARARWLAERKRGIGASDAPAVLSMSPWSSPFELWLDKTGKERPDAPTAAMRWGLLLEDAIAEEWERVHRTRADKITDDDGGPRVLRHPQRAWMLANPDRLVDGNPLEVKTASAWDSGWDDDQVPDHVRIQQQHQMAVLGADRCYGAVLIGGSDWRDWVEERDDEIIGYLTEAESRFWHDYVLADRPPPIDGHKATTEAIKELFGTCDGSEVDLPGDACTLIAEWVEAKRRVKMAGAEVDRFANQLKVLLGEAETGRLDGIRVITHKLIHRDGFTVEPTTYRKLALTRGWKP